ncbi:ligase-associated DNA damage response exonuclease [Sphingobacterium sp. DK4209]|uniref:Ligase-associated DNA damage response exonuclease n=1 Tax=Sphingobacterium zhuxiongii TaxID=2662364 RepID=A0A5Q0QA34_9SPHI|nr:MULTISPECIES: ligase-associated DNA damage response exonuclease [unclassified Sphingobacterium]MVZ64638.1 ligase-associated DNA damage response exonuclease [Sphingobacterium sp. DK4209]QGA26977.1 ligase-associated DNA damage response exonuclease [Sphingobacterium sp. dk4302]
MQILEFRPQGIYCKPGKFYIDPWLPVDKALITHGHADHARMGMKSYLCQRYTTPILRIRLGEGIQVQDLDYNEPLNINGVTVSFHPAGHIIGSAQIRIEYKGKVVVVSGDYKLQNDGMSTPFELVRCHEFITESTFGLPIYQWEPVEQLNKQMQDWILRNQSYGKTSVFIGYSLGKAQRIMKAVEGIADIFVHGSINRLNQAYESVGIQLPTYRSVDLREDLKAINQAVVILPPSLVGTNIIKRIPNMAYAICSGWMAVRGARRWRSADAGFAVSDHADWNDLIEVTRGTGAEKVYVTHGQTAVFSKFLNEHGILSEEIKTDFGVEKEEALMKEDETA